MKFFAILAVLSLGFASAAQAAPKKTTDEADAEAVAVAQTFAACWTPYYDEPVVRLYMLMNQDATISYIDVVDAEKKRYRNDATYRKSADGAIAAIQQCRTLTNLKNYPHDVWEEMELTFDPKIIGKHYVATKEDKAALTRIMYECWKGVTSPFPVKLSLQMEADTSVKSIRVQESDREMYRSVPAYKTAANNAFEAFRSCEALDGLAQYPYEIWKELDLTIAPPTAEYYSVGVTIIPQGD